LVVKYYFLFGKLNLEKENLIEMQGVVTQCLSKCDSFLSN